MVWLLIFHSRGLLYGLDRAEANNDAWILCLVCRSMRPCARLRLLTPFKGPCLGSSLEAHLGRSSPYSPYSSFYSSSIFLFYHSSLTLPSSLMADRAPSGLFNSLGEFGPGVSYPLPSFRHETHQYRSLRFYVAQNHSQHPFVVTSWDWPRLLAR